MFSQPGQTAQLTATATYSDNTTQDVTMTATWQSSNSVVATVSSAGLVAAVALGTASITATIQGKAGVLDIAVAATQGVIGACGVFSGSGPFTVATDFRVPVTGCLTFSDSVGGQLDCQGHEVTSIALTNVQGFSIRNCVMSAGLNNTLRITGSRTVLVEASTVVGSVFVEASQNTTFRNGVFRWPVLPASASGFESSAVYFNGGQNNAVINSSIDGGWDGNFATYQRQGCDDGILIQNEVNSLIRGNVIINVFDAGIESSVSAGPIATTIEGNTIDHAGFTGIGGYYVQGWQDSKFIGNTVTNTPALLDFNTAGTALSHVTAMTLINNQFVNNTLQNPVPRPPTFGGRLAPAMTIDYASGGLPRTVSGNLIQGNNFGTVALAPVLAPADGFVDGGGNICVTGGFLACTADARLALSVVRSRVLLALPRGQAR